jgi:hypothetical protein
MGLIQLEKANTLSGPRVERLLVAMTSHIQLRLFGFATLLTQGACSDFSSFRF